MAIFFEIILLTHAMQYIPNLHINSQIVYTYRVLVQLW